MMPIGIAAHKQGETEALSVSRRAVTPAIQPGSKWRPVRQAAEMGAAP
jgi:hypothetical protein